MAIEVIYLGHSAVCVKTSGHILIFDWYKPNSQNGGLDEGVINLDELCADGREVIFFASHIHPDHFSKNIASSITDTSCSYVLGGFGSGQPNCVTMEPHQEIELRGAKISTGSSTDCGVCYFVSCDGVKIFHAGDNADWGDGMDVDYYGEIDYVAQQAGSPVDIAFIPVCYFSGQRSESMTRGAIYAIQQLSPGTTFPIHANGREYLYSEFKNDADRIGIAGKIVCFDKVGEKKAI